MSAGRWRVYRLSGSPLFRPLWVAASGLVAESFRSWREAYTYADKQARQ